MWGRWVTLGSQELGIDNTCCIDMAWTFSQSQLSSFLIWNCSFWVPARLGLRYYHCKERLEQQWRNFEPLFVDQGRVALLAWDYSLVSPTVEADYYLMEAGGDL